MTDIQRELIKLLGEFDQICRDNDISYFITSGTALGAVRHGGFLPWDDDLDLAIKRDQYEKLNQVMDEALPEGRAWITEDRCPGYGNPVARYVDTDTTLVYRSGIFTDVPMGYNLDVFVMDPFPASPEERKRYEQSLWIYSELDNQFKSYANMALPVDIANREIYGQWMKRCEENGREDTLKELRSFITSFEIGDGVHEWCGRFGRAAYPVEDEFIDGCIPGEFCRGRFPLPRRVFHLMRANYDSRWDILPPVRKRKEHVALRRLDLPYDRVRDAIVEYGESVDFRQLMYREKELRLEQFFDMQEMQENVAAIRAAYLDLEAERLAQAGISGFDAKKVSVYSDLFDDYFRVVFVPSFARFKKELHMGRDLAMTMFMTLIYLDRYDDAAFLAENCPSIQGDPTIGKILFHLGEVKLEKYYGDVDRVREHLDVLTEECGLKQQLEVERCYVWHQSQTTSLKAGKIRHIEESLANGNDPEIITYLGDMYEKTGAAKTARKYYGKAADKTKNGMLLRYLDSKDASAEGPSILDRIKGRIQRFGKARIEQAASSPVPGNGAENIPEGKEPIHLAGELMALLDRMDCPFLIGGNLPSHVNKDRRTQVPGVEIYVPGSRMEEITRLITTSGRKGRTAEFLELVQRGDGEPCPCRALKYVDTETTVMALRDLDHPDCWGMYCTLIPWEEKGDRVEMINVNRIRMSLDSDMIRNQMVMDYRGVTIRLPSNLEEYCRELYRSEDSKVSVRPFSRGDYIFSDHIGYGEIISAVGNWDELKKSLIESEKKLAARGRELEDIAEKTDEIMEKIDEMIREA